MPTEWKNAPDFHVFAEALRINTDQIMGVMQLNRGWGVTWSDSCEGMTLEEMRVVPMFVSILQPDADDILVATSTNTSGTVGDLMDRIDRAMEQDAMGGDGD
jgi:hypothetical protein